MWDKVEKPADWPPLVENAGRVWPIGTLATPR
jgi:hypothetical protein